MENRCHAALPQPPHSPYLPYPKGFVISMCATLISIVYYVQPAFVMPRLARGEAEGIELP